jgi:hypothetical protein
MEKRKQKSRWKEYKKNHKRQKQKRRKACDNKKTFFKFEQAKEKAIKIKRATGKLLKVYECRFCFKFHLHSVQKLEHFKKRKGA